MPLSPSDRLAGCLVGLCLGDALGAPVEGHPPAEAELYAEETLRDGRAPARGRRGHRWGQYTDDGQLARELVRSVIDAGGFDPAHYAGRIAELSGRDGIVDGGQGTLQAAERLLRGVPWQESGSPPPYAGNGAAMRVGPLGVMFRDDPVRLVSAATDQSRITHRDPRCAAGAVVIAGAVCLAQCACPVEPDEFLDQLWRWTATVDGSVAEALVHVGRWLQLDPAEARDAARATHFDLTPTPPRWRGGISPFVTDSVCWAVYAFLRFPDDYWEAIRLAIGVGGDTDTMAAMAGAIAGARVGLAALPTEASRRLTDRGAWGYTELVALCARASGAE